MTIMSYRHMWLPGYITNRFSIHPLSTPYVLSRVAAVKGQGQSRPWTLCHSVTGGNINRDKQPFMLSVVSRIVSRTHTLAPN